MPIVQLFVQLYKGEPQRTFINFESKQLMREQHPRIKRVLAAEVICIRYCTTWSNFAFAFWRQGIRTIFSLCLLQTIQFRLFLMSDTYQMQIKPY